MEHDWLRRAEIEVFCLFTCKYVQSLILLSYEYTDSLEEILFSCLLYFVHKCLGMGFYSEGNLLAVQIVQVISAVACM